MGVYTDILLVAAAVRHWSSENIEWFALSKIMGHGGVIKAIRCNAIPLNVIVIATMGISWNPFYYYPGTAWLVTVPLVNLNKRDFFCLYFDSIYYSCCCNASKG